MPEMTVRCAGGRLRFADGMSSTILPASGTLTSRSPSGVHVSSRAPPTSAHASAFHPRGSVSVWEPWKAPWRLAAGTLERDARVTLGHGRGLGRGPIGLGERDVGAARHERRGSGHDQMRQPHGPRGDEHAWASVQHDPDTRCATRVAHLRGETLIQARVAASTRTDSASPLEEPDLFFSPRLGCRMRDAGSRALAYRRISVKADRHPEVGPDAQLPGHGEVVDARVGLGIANVVLDAAFEHPLAEGLVER